MRGVGRIKKAFRTIRRRIKPAAIILMYHRIADLSTDPYCITVSPAKFSQHLDYIQATCKPMRLLDLVEAMQQNSLPPRAVAITFDDGYSDNFNQAAPLLEAAKVPATVFVTSGYTDSVREFWWDELERLLLLPRHLPARLSICVQGQQYEWPTTSKQEQQLAHKAISSLFRSLTAAERDRKLTELASWAGLGQVGRPGYRPMTTSELTALAQSSFIDIGAHTVSHPGLSTLSLDAQHAEIAGSREKLEATLGRSVLSFAYPFGKPTDFTDETVKIVERAGFCVAVTTIQGTVKREDDLFRLRRFAVDNWTAEKFSRRLESFFLA